MNNQQWRKSSYSAPDSHCVEVAELSDGTRFVRHSLDPSGPSLTYTQGEWDAFVAGVKDGQFD